MGQDQSLDDIIKCADCKKDFLFTAAEKKFFASKGFTPPKRCKPCREKKKAERERRGE